MANGFGREDECARGGEVIGSCHGRARLGGVVHRHGHTAHIAEGDGESGGACAAIPFGDEEACSAVNSGIVVVVVAARCAVGGVAGHPTRSLAVIEQVASQLERRACVIGFNRPAVAVVVGHLIFGEHGEEAGDGQGLPTVGALQGYSAAAVAKLAACPRANQRDIA